eukprot:CAMPEP_0171261582 /NCGR_PEP_ID=MMETSP0790-20130122/56079_1 /TAXON_ID=2925 /ORGANISM="Alexandrium catenella, Strain OF101" /LENGTH=106 /DNA_ID=CAMNT_0011730015 /DNA_START=37 /DNA_END=354 /DNA_ORIENTATION=+
MTAMGEQGMLLEQQPRPLGALAHAVLMACPREVAPAAQESSAAVPPACPPPMPKAPCAPVPLFPKAPPRVLAGKVLPGAARPVGLGGRGARSGRRSHAAPITVGVP